MVLNTGPLDLESSALTTNDLPDSLESSVNLLADDTSLVSIVYDPNMSSDQLDKDLKKIQIGHTNGK